MKRTPLRPVSKKRAKWQIVYRRECAAVNVRSGGRCEADTPDCPPGPHRADHHHHVVLRSRGGLDHRNNLLHVCFSAHDWIHAHPAEATERGLMRSGHTPG